VLRSECPVKFPLSLDTTHHADVWEAWKWNENHIWFLRPLVAQERKG
jgi:hypothetical protein